MVVGHLQSGFFPSPPKVNSLSLSKPNSVVHVVPARAMTKFCLFLFFEYFFTLARERPLEEVTNKVIIVGYF